jgi:type IV pilus assembly protein PilX
VSQWIPNRSAGPRLQQQNGAVLVVSLIILLVLTVVVLSANRGVVIQERMTSAIRESTMVFQAAESGLVHAEQQILLINTKADLDGKIGTAGFYDEGAGPVNYLDKAGLWEAQGTTLDAPNVGSGYTAKYFIENLGQIKTEATDNVTLAGEGLAANSPPEVTGYAFRIVVRAQGADGTPVRLVSGYFTKDVSTN